MLISSYIYCVQGGFSSYQRDEPKERLGAGRLPAMPLFQIDTRNDQP